MVTAYLLMLSSAAVGLSALSPNDTSSWVGGAAALVLLTIAIGFNAGTLVRLRRELKDTKDEQRQDQRVCNYQLGILVDVLTDNGINVPGSFYDVPDETMLQVHEAERVQRRRRMFGFPTDPDNDERGWVTSIFLGTLFAVLAAFAIFALALNGLILGPLRDLQTNSDKADCIASLQADQFASIVFQIQSPPGSDERTVYTKFAIDAAKRIANREKICADGEPDTFILPVPPGI